MPNEPYLNPSGENVPGAGFRPVERLQISTPDQLKTISDPMRLSIIEVIVKEALTVKQISHRLNQPATKLYYHVAELEAAGFVTMVDTRVKSGIIEKYYRATSMNIAVDRKLLDISGAPESASGNLISLALDSTIQELTQSITAGLVDLEGGVGASTGTATFVLARKLVHLRREDVMMFVEKFNALLAELDAGTANGESDAASYACLVAFYPRATRDGHEPA